MKRKTIKIISLLMVFVFIMSITDIGAEAAAQVKTKVIYTNSFKKIIKKAPAIKKGTTIVKAVKKDTCYVKFTAPKTKTYKFTFTPMFTKAQNKVFTLGYFQILRESYGELSTETLKTEGGEYISLNIGNKKYRKAVDTSSEKEKEFLAKRTAKIKIKKGETVYISSNFQKNTANDKFTYKVKIK